ncbi:MAG: DUF3300 domain-containing protein [Woeseia sp.]
MKKEWVVTVFSGTAGLLVALGTLWAGAAQAQVPVDESGEPLQTVEQVAGVADEEAPLLSQAELEELVGPVALYPDNLLAVVLPASTYPLQLVQAARFLERLEEDSSLEPDESWDESVIALLNYPEVVRMMDDDIDWTWRLGEAVIQQQADVVAAVEKFRDRAYAAGNLKSDRRQTVTSNDNGAIEIQPLEEDIIYVPYYEPERVVHYQPRQVYYYYPRPYPVYYYPYPRHHSFAHGYFWGVTTAFQIGWATDHLHVFHSSYWGHPYYGRHYFGHYYRRPSINIYNSYYVNNHHRHVTDRHRDGDYWRPRHDGGARPGHYRARMEQFREPRRERTTEGYRQANGVTGDAARSGFAASRDQAGRNHARDREQAQRSERSRTSDSAIRFRSREGAASASRDAVRRSADSSNSAVQGPTRGNSDIRFRSRGDALRDGEASRRDNAAFSSAGRDAVRTRRSAPAPSAGRSRPRDEAARAPAARPQAAPSRGSQRALPQRSTTPRATAPARSAPKAAPRTRAAPAARSTAPARSAPRASTPPRSAPARSSRATSETGTGSRRGSNRQ